MSSRGEAVLYGTLGKEMYERYGRDKLHPMAAMLHHLGVSLYHSREYKAAIDVLTKYLSHAQDGYLSRTDTISIDYDMFAWNALGLAYLKSGSPDSGTTRRRRVPSPPRSKACRPRTCR